MPDQSKLPVRKNTNIAARAAIGKANKNPMKTIAANAMISRTSKIHQNWGSLRLNTCKANKNYP